MLRRSRVFTLGSHHVLEDGKEAMAGLQHRNVMEQGSTMGRLPRVPALLEVEHLIFSKIFYPQHLYLPGYSSSDCSPAKKWEHCHLSSIITLPWTSGELFIGSRRRSRKVARVCPTPTMLVRAATCHQRLD